MRLASGPRARAPTGTTAAITGPVSQQRDEPAWLLGLGVEPGGKRESFPRGLRRAPR